MLSQRPSATGPPGRYDSCGGGEDETSREIVGELLKHLEHAAMENVGEFCEAS